jgi:hypothetical protein
MSLGQGAKHTSVTVTYRPVQPDDTGRASLRITVLLGTRPSEEEHILFQRLLATVRSLQRLNR